MLPQELREENKVLRRELSAAESIEHESSRRLRRLEQGLRDQDHAITEIKLAEGRHLAVAACRQRNPLPASLNPPGAPLCPTDMKHPASHDAASSA